MVRVQSKERITQSPSSLMLHIQYVRSSMESFKNIFLNSISDYSNHFFCFDYSLLSTFLQILLLYSRISQKMVNIIFLSLFRNFAISIYTWMVFDSRATQKKKKKEKGTCGFPTGRVCKEILYPFISSFTFWCSLRRRKYIVLPLWVLECEQSQGTSRISFSLALEYERVKRYWTWMKKFLDCTSEWLTIRISVEKMYLGTAVLDSIADVISYVYCIPGSFWDFQSIVIGRLISLV